MQLLCTHASAFTFVNVPSCLAGFCEWIHQGFAFHCISLRLFVHLHQCMLWACIGKPVQSVVSCCLWSPLVCCSTILHLSIVSGLFLFPHHPLFPLFVISLGVPCPSLLGGDSWLGCQDLPAMGAVSSRSSLGHSSSIGRCCCELESFVLTVSTAHFTTSLFQFLRAFEAYIGSLEDMKTDKYSDKERGVEPQTARW